MNEKKIIISEPSQKKSKKNKKEKKPLKTEEVSQVRIGQGKHVDKIMDNLSSAMPGVSPNVKQARMVAMSMVMPGGCETQRWATNYSQQATAVVAPFDKYPANWGQTGVTGAVLAATETAAFLFRNPYRASIIYDQNASNLVSRYVGSVGKSNDGFQQIKTERLVDTTFLILSNVIPTSSYKPHGSIMFAGLSKESRAVSSDWLWADACTSVSFVFDATYGQAGAVITFGYDTYDSYGVYYVASEVNFNITATTSNNSIQIKGPTANGFYFSPYIRVTGSGGIGGFVNVKQIVLNDSVPGSHFCHRTLNGMDVNVGSTQGIRVIGGSLLYTNSSPEQNLSGLAAMVQTGSSSDWMDFLNIGNMYNTIVTMEGAVNLVLNNGMYGFLKPSSSSDYDFLSVAKDISGKNITGSYYIEEGNFIVFTASNSNPLGCIGQFTTSFALEYKTNDPWRDVTPNTTSFQVSDMALAHVRDVPQFYDNFGHVATLLARLRSLIHNASSKVVDWAPKVVKTATFVRDITAP